MLQNKKIIVIVASLLVAALLVGGGFALGHHHAKTNVVTDASSQTTATNDTSSGGLAVSNSTSANDLGQLSGNQSGQTGSSGSNTNASASSSNSAANPANFAQYDKYATNSTALFGDITVGSGAALGANQTASITYKGWLTNGTLFDQSPTAASGQLQPLNFTLGSHQVIPGMEEGVAGMKVGGTRLIIVPPALGYGSQGQGTIPANAVLVFEVTLAAVK